MHNPGEQRGPSKMRRFYRALLRVLPFEFRAEFGGDMEEAFSDEHHDLQRRHDWLETAAFWVRTAIDFARTAPREHWDLVRHDLRVGSRVLLRDRAFAVTAVLTLALGIGGAVAIFSVVRAVVLRPLPFPESDRLVAIESRPRKPTDPTGPLLSYPVFTTIAAQCPAFDSVGVVHAGGYEMTEPRGGRSIPVSIASASLFKVLRATTVAGRLPNAADEQPGAPLVAVITHPLWTSRFGSDRSMVGRTFTRQMGRAELRAVTVVGVLAPDFVFPYPLSAAEEVAWSPLQWDTEMPGANPRGTFTLDAYARLRDGVSLDRARADLGLLQRRLMDSDPGPWFDRDLRAIPLLDTLVGGARAPLMAFFGAVSFLLLIACVNIASLMLARAHVRRQEFAVRAALGARPARVARLLLTESLLVAGAGCIAGLALAWAASRAFVAISPSLPRLHETAIDWWVVVFALLATLVATVVTGLAPAIQFARSNVADILGRPGTSHGATGRNRRALGILAVLELALALTLLAGAGLLVNSFVRLVNFDLGMDPRSVVAVQISHRSTSFNRAAWQQANDGEKRQAVAVLDAQRRAQAAFNEQIVERMSVLPGVDAAGTTSVLPLSGDPGRSSVVIEGQEESTHPLVTTVSATPGYFQALGIRLVRGRWFNPADREGSPLVALVNETMARRFWPGGHAIGKHVLVSRRRVEIVGIIGDVHHAGPQGDVPIEIFQPDAQAPSGYFVHVVVKVARGSAGLERAVRADLDRLGAAIEVKRVQRLDDLWSELLARPRFNTLILGAFSLCAIILALVGVHGVLRYSTVQRRRELGIRAALGATRGDLVRLVLGQALRYAAIGAVVGVSAALAAGKAIQSLLFGVGPNDAFTLTSVTLLMLGAVVAAAYWPARGASAVDPVASLRCE